MNRKVIIAVTTIVVVFSAICILVVASTRFELTGKWKNVGEDTFGQVQKNSIVVFDGTYCNLYSPKDTYVYDKDSSTLTITSYLFNESFDFTLIKISKDKIRLNREYIGLELERVE